jgi:KaiC/GvpD/RAD55 family RecA-like ATPase
VILNIYMVVIEKKKERINYMGVERVPTGIEGFDKLIEGGFPKFSNILLNGGPGTGKTIFALEYIYNGFTKYNEPGLYVTFEQSRKSLIEQAILLGMDLDKRKIKILHINPHEVSSIGEMVGLIHEVSAKLKAKRIVIDSLPALYFNAENKATYEKEECKDKINFFFSHKEEKIGEGLLTPKSFVYLFLEILSDMKLTTLLIGETSENPADELSYLSQYVCDGVIILKKKTIGEEINRTIHLEKMRNTNLKIAMKSFEFEKNGIIID